MEREREKREREVGCKAALTYIRGGLGREGEECAQANATTVVLGGEETGLGEWKEMGECYAIVYNNARDGRNEKMNSVYK